MGNLSFGFVLSKWRGSVCRNSETARCQTWEVAAGLAGECLGTGDCEGTRRERWLCLVRLWYLWPAVVKGWEVAWVSWGAAVGQICCLEAEAREERLGPQLGDCFFQQLICHESIWSYKWQWWCVTWGVLCFMVTEVIRSMGRTGENAHSY